VVLSRRAWLEQTQSEVRSEFLNQLTKGAIRKGVVSSIVNFGAFVDLGGVDGLVHVSELSWKHIDHPSEVVNVGDEVTVEVLDVDMDRERVSLSLKATQEDPWRHFARTTRSVRSCRARSPKLVPFGAFVRVEEGIEGLVHISELSERHVEVPDQVVQVGDDAMVKVIDIDLERRRISLSLKQANEDYTEEFDPSKYGMADSYDEQGNYIFPEASTPRPTSGSRVSTSSVKSGSPATRRPSVGTRCTPRRWRSSPLPRLRRLPSLRRQRCYSLRGAIGRWVAGQRRPARGPAGEARRQRIAAAHAAHRSDRRYRRRQVDVSAVQ